MRMHKISAVIRHEINLIIGRRSYLWAVFLVPMIGFLIYNAAAWINRGIAPEGITDFFTGSSEQVVQGLVDRSGLVEFIPDSVDERIVQYSDEKSARSGIAANDISSYFVIETDYLESGEIRFVQEDYNFLATTAETSAIRAAIIHNLFSDQSKANRYLNPSDYSITYIHEKIEKDFREPREFWLPYALMMAFYILIVGASSLMLTSITHEKQNRVMEILLSSTSPREMLIGKIIALGIVGLFQTIIWLISGYALIQLSGQEFALPEMYLLSPELLIWGILFFILGYAVYSSLMAGLGALVPDPKEGSQATIVVIFPLIIPLFFSSMAVSMPNAPIFVFFSIFPLTAPISMVARMSATIVPLWQVLLTVLLQITTIFIIIHGTSRIFRTQNLLSGKSFQLKAYLCAFFKNE